MRKARKLFHICNDRCWKSVSQILQLTEWVGEPGSQRRNPTRKLAKQRKAPSVYFFIEEKSQRMPVPCLKHHHHCHHHCCLHNDHRHCCHHNGHRHRFISALQKQYILRHVYTTMSSQALFMFESFSAMIALESLLLVVGYFVPSQITH